MAEVTDCEPSSAPSWYNRIVPVNAEGIGATFHYVPLHSAPFSRDRWGYRPEDLPVTERVGASLVRLPLFAAMTDDELEQVAEATLKVLRAILPAAHAS